MGKAQRENWGDDVNYLLGRMTEAERETVREQLLTDGDAFDRLREAENDLFDAYARNTLGLEERAAFERTLLRQPGAAAKLGLARSWAPSARRMPQGWWISAAIAASILAAVIGWRATEPATVPAPAPVVLVAQSFRLTAVTRGSAQVQQLVLAPDTAEMEFVAEAPAGARAFRYEVEVARDGGAIVWSGSVSLTNQELRWRVPALSPGPYVIRVGSVAQPLAFYEIRVTRP